MRYWFNVYRAGSVYLDLRFYTASADLSRSAQHSTLPSRKSHERSRLAGTAPNGSLKFPKSRPSRP